MSFEGCGNLQYVCTKMGMSSFTPACCTSPSSTLACPCITALTIHREEHPLNRGWKRHLRRVSNLPQFSGFKPGNSPQIKEPETRNISQEPLEQFLAQCEARRGPRSRLSTPGDNGPEDFLKQPETRPISQEQLVAEVKGIYAGLLMVEGKCIEVDNNHRSQTDLAELNAHQWQALIALHRTLLHEHHDFFLASQHPSASPALRRLAEKYAMPARMWQHGIHSFLELLRHRLPTSLDHMLTFIYMAYSMVGLLYETVPAFQDTWIECLGDLGRYRMAIENDDRGLREVWTSVSRHWYSQRSDKAPTVGRLYHHLAILARPSPLQQLHYYSKSLCVELPFSPARDSIMTVFEPIMPRTSNTQQAKLPPTERSYIKTQGILFSGKYPDKLDSSMRAFLKGLDNHIRRRAREWIESGSVRTQNVVHSLIPP